MTHCVQSETGIARVREGRPALDSFEGMMPPLPSTADSSDLDEDRKKELIMEKKLRACRVNIIPRTAGYFTGPAPIPAPVSKKPPAPAPVPESVEKASNPIALRYWNQCTTDRKISEPALSQTIPLAFNDPPPWATSDSSNNLSLPPQPQHKPKARTPTSFPVRVPDITKRVRSESVPRFCNFDDEPLTIVDNKVEVVKVLSTAGTGIKRDNEKMEALGNINRFITMDKMKKDDAARAESNKQREIQMQEVKIETVPSTPYSQVKEEQIKISSERSHFMNNAMAARIPKSPEPFRGRHRDLSEPRHSTNNNRRPQPSTNNHLTVTKKNPPPKENPPLPRENPPSPPKENPPAPPKKNSTSSPRENGHQKGSNKVESILSQIKTLQDDEKHKIFLTLFHEMSFSAKSNLMANILEELKSVNGNSSGDQITNCSVSGASNMTSDNVSNLINSSCQTNLKHDNSKPNDPKEKNVFNAALADNKSATEEVKNHKTNLDNVSFKSFKSCDEEPKVEAKQQENVCEIIVTEDTEVGNHSVTVNVPDIKIDLLDSEEKTSEEDNEDGQAEWEWEDGEEMEYEFYEQEL